ncbi:hypothetical protein OSB04_023660 [Centaurea solstitialis]|uniref:Uncharacterized protein n=1 Tax=Centaurea solstitialis TaxID=347529 RepID=A0AA38T493_9ASTR|nr:hypothetical protein OSB04_023660 [Centaurea solstitialis]
MAPVVVCARVAVLGSEDRLLVVGNEARCGRYVESCSTSLKVEESLSYIESPIAVLRLRNKKSSTEKVQGQHRKESEWIREQEVEMLEKYRDFLQIDFGDEIRAILYGTYGTTHTCCHISCHISFPLSLPLPTNPIPFIYYHTPH